MFRTSWITAKGYRRGRLAEPHPFPRACGLYYEHIVVMERELGRRMEPWEHVHHVDGDKLHNAPENLEVREADDHSSYHAQRQPRCPAGRYVAPPPDPDDPPF